jgi:hypothetical protein
MKAIRLLGFWICLLLGLALAALAQRSPPVVPASAPPDAFSAERAMSDVRAIAMRPHPTGSTDIVRVREHLMARITSLGLELSVRADEGYTTPRNDGRWLAAGAVQNVIGVLPGADRSKPAVLIMSHYDSVANSPGAADDAAGVAAALEIARALKAGPTPARDVIFLFTDGEEQGLLGADAFFARDPLREKVGMVINMEARGDSGRAAMFQTGPQNGALMALFAREAKRPAANSLAAAIYEKMPNDTDFTHAVKAGLPGLNFAFIDDELAYHTPLARAEHLDQGSLQHFGDQVLPTVRALASGADLPGKAPNAIYSDVFGLFLISYPIVVGWGLLALAGVLVLYALVRGLMIRATGPVELLKGLAGFLLVGTSGALVLHLTGKLLHIADLQAHYALLGRFDPLLLGCTAILVGVALAVVIGQAKGAARIWPSLLALLAGGATCLIGGPPALDQIGVGLGAASAVLVWASLGKPVGVLGAWIGALVGLLAIAVALMILLPGGSVMAVWPLLVAALAAVLVLAKGGTRNRRVALALTFCVALAAVVVVVQVGAWGGWTFAGLGVSLPAILAVFGLLALPALIPLAHDFSALKLAALPATLVAAVGAGLVAYAVLAGATPARPELTEAAHLADLSSGRAWRISTLPRLDAWSRGALTAQGGTPAQGDLPPFFKSKIWMAEARPVALDPPQLVVEQAGERLLVRVIPGPGAEYVTLRIKPDGMLAGARLNGRPIPLTTKHGEWTSLTYHAPDPNGVTLSFSRLNGSGHVEAAALEVREGWPRAAPSPGAKPEGLMGWGVSDKTLVLTRASVRW